MRAMSKFYWIVLLAVGFSACKKWDDHIAVENQDLNQNLLEAISSTPSLSAFRNFVKQAGLDSLLQSTKEYTVWAPNNDALQNLDPAIAADPVKLKSFVLNHISNQIYFTRNAAPGTRIPMLSGKYNAFTATTFEDAGIKTADKFVRNGVLHSIDKGIVVLPNLWEFVNSTAAQYAQNNYLLSLNFNSFDPSLATIDSISSTTGLPIYHAGTGLVARNRFNDRVYDLKREDKQYTYLIFNNTAFAYDADSLKGYFKAGTTALTDSLTRWNVVKDLAFEGVLAPTALIGLISKSGIALPAITPAMIVDTKKLSNGVAYVLSNIHVPNANKFKEIRIEGENPSGFLTLKTANTNYRIRTNPVTGQIFSDLMVSGHGVTGYYAFYRLDETPSIKYNVYALGVNDFQTGAFSQGVIIKALTQPSTTTLSTFTHTVPLVSAAGAYNEVLLGTATSTVYGTLEIQLTAYGTAPALGTNPLVLDYIRLVPVP
jgi:uncharacterized surface protein with fasciclin (FAS1) repeats